MLFKNNPCGVNRAVHASGPTPGVRRRIVIIEEPRRPRGLPDFMTRLDVLCRDPQHVLPCKTRFIGHSTSDRGDPLVIYACPLCRAREGWGLDHRGNQPRRIFRKPGSKQ